MREANAGKLFCRPKRRSIDSTGFISNLNTRSTDRLLDYRKRYEQRGRDSLFFVKRSVV